MYSIYCRTRAKQVTIRRSCSVNAAYDLMAPMPTELRYQLEPFSSVKVAYVSDLILLKLRKLS